jgi:16S rRNA (cytosine967-C5)-methyltransferase
VKKLTSRQVAVQVLTEIENGARANDSLASFLASSGRGLSRRDRGFVTELVQGTTRMRRAIDHVLQPFLRRKLDPDVRAALRMGAHQLLHLGTPPHAAVNDTVAVTPRRASGLVNAVLRKVSNADPQWPTGAIRYSYPDWIWDLFIDTWGQDGRASLIAMNSPERPSPRPDGYIQGQASRWVSDEVDDASPDGGSMLDLCAAPGGKTTALGSQWSPLYANDIDAARAKNLQETVGRFRPGTAVVISDGTSAAFGDSSVDAVLVDAPCTGLGALGRRSDARWQISESAISRLVLIQTALLDEAFRLLRPGGVLSYSVCTVTNEETIKVPEDFQASHRELTSIALGGSHWRPHRQGGIVLPHDQGTDGMAMFQWKRQS